MQNICMIRFMVTETFIRNHLEQADCHIFEKLSSGDSEYNHFPQNNFLRKEWFRKAFCELL